MSEKIVALRGCPLPTANGEPCSAVVEAARRILDDAESGKAQGLAYGLYDGAGVLKVNWAAAASVSGTMMVGLVSRLLYALQKSIDQQDAEDG